VTDEGPALGFGLFLLALALAPALLLDTQPWKAVAIANAAVHLVTGFSFTMVGTRFSRPLKNLGMLIWSLTCLVTIVLLVAAIFVS
jgi:hypothetical protein